MNGKMAAKVIIECACPAGGRVQIHAHGMPGDLLDICSHCGKIQNWDKVKARLAHHASREEAELVMLSEEKTDG